MKLILTLLSVFLIGSSTYGWGETTPADVHERASRSAFGRAESVEPGDDEDVDVGSFEDFVLAHNPTLLRYEHIPRLVSVGQRIADGELSRVLVLMPPRYFKSETFSRLLPAYYLRRHPARKVGLASYGAQLAWELSEEARTYYAQDGGELSIDTSAKRRWRLTHHDEDAGEMWADGVGGSLLGRGYHLGIIDDPQDPEQAHSGTFQKRFKEWYPSKWYSRQEPGAAIVVVMQRLSPGDAIEYLFEREYEAPEGWHVVICDEIKSNEPLWRGRGPRGLPETCSIEPDERDEGELLAPTRFSMAQVTNLQRANLYVTKAQRQQRPSALTGDFWKHAWFNVYKTLPEDAYNGGRDWDTAFTKNERNSASADVESYRGPGDPDSFPIYIEDADWDWLEFPELVKRIESKKGPHHIEEKASGKSAAQSLRREGVKVHEVAVAGGDKLARASSVQPVVSNGRVWVNERVLKKLLEGAHPDPKRNGRQGLLSVTAENLAADSGDLDLNDAFVQAITRHVSKIDRTPSVTTRQVQRVSAGLRNGDSRTSVPQIRRFRG